jgi:FAD/FMN-containing dehydrogenase
MTTACACVGYVSPILGGGHGWNQGRYGLASDQLVSANMVLANGTAITVSEDGNPDLFWAIRGAGHNFGIVTEAKIKIYDVKPSLEKWAVSGFFFTHDKMKDAVAIANTWLESANKSVALEHYVVFSFNPEVDPVNVSRIFHCQH